MAKEFKRYLVTSALFYAERYGHIGHLKREITYLRTFIPVTTAQGPHVDFRSAGSNNERRPITIKSPQGGGYAAQNQ